MLRYLGLGLRELGDCPMPPHARVNWEFLAVVRGHCAPTARPDEKPPLATNTLWLFPPGYRHGWVGQPGEKCEVFIVHFNAVPVALERVVTEHGFLATRLTARDRRWLARLSRSLKHHYWHPILASELHTERALMDLGLLLLRAIKESHLPHQSGASLDRVLRAENWLRNHLAESPSIADGARAAGLSSSQLRRLFWKVRKAHPQRVLDRLRVNRAMHLMTESDAKLESVARECGFAGATSLCRAFKAIVGNSPTVWRKEIYIQYKRPSETKKGDYASHGRRVREL